MTNVSQTPEKVETRARLRRVAFEALESMGWKVETVRGHGRARVRRISKDGVSKIASFKTTQDQWVAYVPNPGGGWWTLAEVDTVVVASVDDVEHPADALIHIFDAREMEARYDRAYQARKDAGYHMPDSRGIWISLYEAESDSPVTLVGAGAGLESPPVATVPLYPDRPASGGVQASAPGQSGAPPSGPPAAPTVDGADEPPLTIAEAKRRLAATLGVSPASIKISVEA